MSEIGIFYRGSAPNPGSVARGGPTPRSAPSRRDALRRLGLALMAAGGLDRVAAQEVHHMATEAQAASAGPYAPKSFTAPEFRTLERLTDLIIPVENAAPGALAAGCAAWIDMISSENDQLKKIYKDGFAWVDGAMKTRGATSFVDATPEQQTALLDQIAFRRNQSLELNPGIEFFTWVRRMTVDAFYTSEIGIKDIDYRGNSPMGSYPEPTEQIAYVLKRVPGL
jgi:Gluconate 2-dehydrogenase subunit 3